MKPYFDDGSIRIYLGRMEDVVPSLEGFDVVVTSPPYNTLPTGKPSGLWAQTKGGLAFFESALEAYPDAMVEEDYIRSQIDALDLLFENANDGASLFYNHKIRWRDGVISHPVLWTQPTRWTLRQEIVWFANNGLTLNARMFVPTEERILWFAKGRHRWNQEAVGFGSVWNINRVQRQHKSGKHHPVEYPLAIPLRCIMATTVPESVVLDPYMGSGTTLRAAKDLNRRAIGIEREERYCEVAAERMSQSTLGFEPGSASS